MRTAPVAAFAGVFQAESVGLAKEYLTEAIRQAYPIGAGHGPVNHFWNLWAK